MSIFMCPTCGETSTVMRVCTTKGCDIGLVPIAKCTPLRRDDEGEQEFSTRKAHMESQRAEATKTPEDEAEVERRSAERFARVWQ